MYRRLASIKNTRPVTQDRIFSLNFQHSTFRGFRPSFLLLPYTAIIITWDDWGGWYDHVAPTIQNSYEYGFRVPLIVVSPYAKRAYVSHVTHDFGSLLKFIEFNFKLPSLGFADSPVDDLSDCFDFKQTPPPFQLVAAPIAASHFLAETRPPIDPDDD